MPYTDELNEVVWDYQISRDWEWRDAAKVAHEWFGLFNREFCDGQLPTPFITFDGTGRDAPARYRYNPNGAGVRHEIAIRKGYIEGPRSALLAVLLHAVVHEWEAHYCSKQGSQGNHKRAFRRECERIGIPCAEGRSCATTAHRDPLMALLREQGVSVHEIMWEPVPGEPVLVRWECECTTMWATRQTEVHAVCSQCGFALQQKGRN